MSRILFLLAVSALAIAILVFVRFAQSPPVSREIQEQQKQYAKLELQNWHEFTPQSNGFKVLFPTLPQHATEKLNDPHTNESRLYDMFVSQKENGNIYMISVITLLDPTIKLNESMLSSVVDNMVTASPTTKVTKMEMGNYKTYPSIDFSLESPQGYVDGKAFLVGNRLYMLTGVSNLTNYNRMEFDFFVNSFQLTSDKLKSN